VTPRLGAHVAGGTTRFAVRAPLAEALELCLFAGGEETRRAMTRQGEVWVAEMPGDLTGTSYGYRAHGAYAPDRNLWFDPAELRHALEVFEALYLDHIVLEESMAYPEARNRLLGSDTVGMGREMARRRVMRKEEVLAR